MPWGAVDHRILRTRDIDNNIVCMYVCTVRYVCMYVCMAVCDADNIIVARTARPSPHHPPNLTHGVTRQGIASLPEL